MKKIVSLLLVLIITISLSGFVFADDSAVTFLGLEEGFDFAPGSSYTDSDMFENFKNVMPGDHLTEVITVANDAKDCDYIKIYMRAVVHDEAENPLSPNVAADGETVASMEDFLAQLSMKVYHGDDLIFNAAPHELDGLAENVLLGEFRSGETTTLTVELDVPDELDNRYAHRTGEVDWVFTVEGFDDPVPPPVEKTRVTVKKLWNDGNAPDRPESVTVELLRNEEVYDTVVLREDNHWTYTWSNLSRNASWDVREVSVPNGYTVEYERSGHVVTIINTREKAPTPSEPEDLTVVKKWSDTKDMEKNRPDSVKVTLYRDKTPVETVILGQWNDWTFTWNDLSGDSQWSVTEVEIPKGYSPIYSRNGNTVTITNSAVQDTGLLQWPILVMGGLGGLLLLFGMYLILRRKKNDHA